MIYLTTVNSQLFQCFHVDFCKILHTLQKQYGISILRFRPFVASPPFYNILLSIRRLVGNVAIFLRYGLIVTDYYHYIDLRYYEILTTLENNSFTCVTQSRYGSYVCQIGKRCYSWKNVCLPSHKHSGLMSVTVPYCIPGLFKLLKLTYRVDLVFSDS